MEVRKNGVVIECMQGDIARQPDVEAVVNAANAMLMPGGGVAGAIHRAAGPELAEACRPLAPIKPGEAVITPGFRLPNKYVIHCLGPVYGVDKPEEVLLGNCYRNALRLAEEHHVQSIAFPAISTGIFGYPIKEAVQVVIPLVLSETANLKTLKRIRFVLFGARDFAYYVEYLRGQSL